MSSTPPGTPLGITSTTSQQMLSVNNEAVNDYGEPSPPSSFKTSSLSPADCRTLHKLLVDVGSSSPLSLQPHCSAKRSSLPASDSGAPGLLIPEDEDDSFHEMEQFDYANEQEAGYEDDDESMELNGTDDSLDTQEQGSDTVGGLMNLPGATTPSLPVQDFDSFCGHDTSSALGDIFEHPIRSDRKHAHHQNTDLLWTTTEEPDESVLNSSSTQVNQPSSYHLQPNRRRSASDDGYSRFNPVSPFPHRNSACFEFSLPAPIPNIPFSPAMAHYNSLENSSPKRRRKASSPEELAQLARRARIDEEEAEEEKELQELDQYRDFDLAPIEPVMESEAAGDLIMCGTPVRVRNAEGWDDPISPSVLSGRQDMRKGSDFAVVSQHIETEDIEAGCLTRPCAPTPSSRRPKLPVEQEEDADIEDWDIVLEREDEDVSVQSYEATFMTVIAMLPAAMFWATAALVLKLGDDAVDTLVEKLTGLKVKDVSL